MRNVLLVLMLLLPLPAIASSDKDVSALLQETSPPDGVVFEVITTEEGLRWAVPQIVRYSQQLRERFPALPIAVVSHGREEFALQRSRQTEFPEVHLAVESLSREQGIPVHVCGTHAGWKGVTPEEFPDYVNVAPVGPAQIRDYLELGYRLIILTRSP